MENEKLLQEIRENMPVVISRRSDFGKALWTKFSKLHPADIAAFFNQISKKNFHKLFLHLPKKQMCKVFTELSEASQTELLAYLNNNDRVGILSCLTADEITDLFEHLSNDDIKKYIQLLHKKEQYKVLSLLAFSPDSAGGIMETDVLSLYQDFTVKKSIDLIQKFDIKRDLYRHIFVTNKRHQLLGYIKLEDLLLQKSTDEIKNFLRENIVVAEVHEDQEKVAKKMIHYNITIAPVVDEKNVFLGVIPSRTLVDVIEEEASENVYRMSAMEPVKGTYFDVPFFKLLYKRSYILVILLLAQSLSSMIIQHHEQLLAGILMAFITMLISTGGNASSQTSAVIIQGMASGEINKGNMHRFFTREIMLAVTMGLVLGAVAFGRVYLTTRNYLVSLAVSASLGCIVVVSMSIGSVIPVVLKRLNLDPAYSAGPFLATLMDILGLLIYCTVSKMFIFS